MKKSVEYKETLNVSNAITTVTNRFKAIEEEKNKQEKIEKTEIVQETKQEEVLTKPEEILTLNFTVKATLTKLKALKEFLINGGYDYE